MRSRIASFVILTLFACVGAALGQSDPDTERGVRPGLAYKVDGLDQVNLFNGTMTVNVPIGSAYTVNGTLSYSFMASYATNTWETAFNEYDENNEIKEYEFRYPSPHANAGHGWLVTLGALIAESPETPGVKSYLAPDGGRHTFNAKLHDLDPNESGTDEWSYTRDGTYLRMRSIPGGYEIQFPNGHSHEFNTDGLLTSMEDPYGNYVHVTIGTRQAGDSYAGSPLWTITDSVGRVHKIYFRPNWAYDEIPSDPNGTHPSPIDRHMVDRIELAAFDDPTDTSDGVAEYQFNYVASPSAEGAITFDHKTSRRCRPKHDFHLAEYVVTSLLSSIDMPENVTYGVMYDRGDRDTCSLERLGGASGNIVAMTMPTGARTEWTYQTVYFGTSAQTYNIGVKERKVYKDTTLLGQTDHEVGTIPRVVGSSSFKDAWRRVVNRDAVGGIIAATTHYFTFCRDSTSGCGNGGEYGLPLTRVETLGSAYLSSVVEKWDASTSSYIPLRKTWVRYEADRKMDVNWHSMNQRLAYQRTDYCDEDPSDPSCTNPEYSDIEYSNFDGLGHYRTGETGGNFEKGNTRTSHTNFNPSSGEYELDTNGNLLPGFTLPSGSTWLLTTFDRQWTAEGSTSVVTEYCFDSTGFLTARRALKDFGDAAGNSATKATADLLALFTRNGSGNLVKEQYFGGDVVSQAPANYSCGATLTGETYRIDHGYQYGTRNSSKYMNSGGASMTFDLLDADVDQNTGLIKTSRLYSTVGLNDGAAVSYVYDVLGRPEKVFGEKVNTQYGYQLSPPKITISEYDASSPSTLLSQSAVEYDALGRATLVSRSMPGGATSSRETKYNAAGWVTEIKDWGATAATVYTYDALGRPVKIRRPDQTDVLIAYNGTSTVTRTTKVRTGGDATTLTLTDAVTTEEYDRQGRLIRVTEPQQSVGGSRPITEYEYDVGGRLKTVCANKTTSCGQTRTLSYDGRGLLTSETHPESGTTTYVAYDARGHLRRRHVSAAGGQFDLGFEYDRAERITQVHQADVIGNEVRKLKYFTYGTNNSAADLRNGRLVDAMRFNWVNVGGNSYNVRVMESYKYEDPEGSVSSRTTQDFICQVTQNDPCTAITAGTVDRTFSQTFTYDALGGTKTLGYPKCLHANCSGLIGDRTITNGYDQGFLTSVTWTGATLQNTLTYHPSGLLWKVNHDNGVVDEQTVDAAVPSRPLSLITTNALDSATCVIPSFTQQPQSTTIEPPGSATLSALATGETGQAITYKWYRGVAPDTNNEIGTGSSVVVSPTVTTSYWVAAKNSCSGSGAGTASVTATVTVCYSPEILAGPADRTITRTTSTTLQVTASGSATLQYQWYTVSGGAPSAVSGATQASLNVSPSQNTQYRVVVTNDCGSVSDDVFVTVVDPPTAPAAVTATYDAGYGRIVVSWGPSSSQVEIGHYEIERMPDGRLWSVTATTTFTDTYDLVAGRAYVYRVTAIDTQQVSSDPSNPDLATTMAFSNDPLLGPAEGGGSPIRGLHISELRQAIDAVRIAAGLAPVWSSYAPATGPVSPSHFVELRTRLNEGRAELLLPPVTFSGNVASLQAILRSTVTELRNGVK